MVKTFNPQSERVTLDDTDSTIIQSGMIQVMHLDSTINGEAAILDYGKVENIKDELSLRPRVYDTLIILDSDIVKDSVLHSSYKIWGKYKGYLPQNIANDTTEIFYHKVVVIKTLVEK